MAHTTSSTVCSTTTPAVHVGSGYRIRLKLRHADEPPRAVAAPKVSLRSAQAAQRRRQATARAAPYLNDKGSLFQIPKLQYIGSPSAAPVSHHSPTAPVPSSSCVTLQAAALDQAPTLYSTPDQQLLSRTQHHSQCSPGVSGTHTSEQQIGTRNIAKHSACTTLIHERPSKRIKLPSSDIYIASGAAQYPPISTPACDINVQEADQSSSVAAPRSTTPIPNTSRLWDGLFPLIREELNHRKQQYQSDQRSPSQRLSQLQFPAERKSLVIPLHSLSIPALKDGLPTPKRLVIRYNKHLRPIFRRSEKEHHPSSSSTAIPVQSDIPQGCNIKRSFSKKLAKIERRVARIEERRRKRGHPKPKNPKKLGHYYRPSFKPSLATILEEEGEVELEPIGVGAEDCHTAMISV